MGINTAVTLNSAFGAPREAKTALDFMPSRWQTKAPAPKHMNNRKLACSIRAALLPVATSTN